MMREDVVKRGGSQTPAQKDKVPTVSCNCITGESAKFCTQLLIDGSGWLMMKPQLATE